MTRRLGGIAGVSVFSALVLAFEPFGQARPLTGSTAQPMITAAVSDTDLVGWRGNTRPEANALNDLGIVPDTLRAHASPVRRLPRMTCLV
jgi:hypothetical protein